MSVVACTTYNLIYYTDHISIHIIVHSADYTSAVVRHSRLKQQQRERERETETWWSYLCTCSITAPDITGGFADGGRAKMMHKQSEQTKIHSWPYEMLMMTKNHCYTIFTHRWFVFSNNLDTCRETKNAFVFNKHWRYHCACLLFCTRISTSSNSMILCVCTTMCITNICKHTLERPHIHNYTVIKAWKSL